MLLYIKPVNTKVLNSGMIKADILVQILVNILVNVLARKILVELYFRIALYSRYVCV